MAKQPSKSGAALTLFDKLSRLTFVQAARTLGTGGAQLINQGGACAIDIDAQVELHRDALRLSLGTSTVVLALNPAVPGRLAWRCDTCAVACLHVGAAFALVLEEKLTLGLAAPPVEVAPIESLGEDELIARAVEERQERARSEKMRLTSTNPADIWTDYTLTNAASGKSYRLALRGWLPGESYCSCPDFRKNTLGTCKHILHALTKVQRKFPAAVRKRPYRQTELALHLSYGDTLELRLLVPDDLPAAATTIIRPLRDGPITDLGELVKRLRRLQRQGVQVTVYPDAEEFLRVGLLQQHLGSVSADIRRDPAAHPLRTTLLKADLLPYQLDGIAFVAAAGRAVLADDMGLGKTIQGIGVAELLARKAGIAKVLVVCPASVKSQWRAEIERFCGRSCQLILGSADERNSQYANDCFFTICNYEQVLRDVLAVERVTWDLIILDEGQRIKNWEAKTSQVIKSLRSPFAMVLSGTPLENRLDDLFSIVEFIDARRLGPAFRFFNRHRVTDERGKVLGYRDLDALRANLQPVLLRRTRAAVLRELPPRSTEIVRIPPTDEQLGYDAAQMQVVSSIVNKAYISEMDLLRLQKALLLARMNADSTFLVDRVAPGYSTKLERLGELLAQLAEESDRKIVLFSEWTTMLGLIEPLAAHLGLDYVRLDGSVPQKKRQQLVRRFQEEPTCRMFMTTNAGATGLNLQAANTVINVDLPWNPAVLEQRIARAHRMGQRNPVQVYLLVTASTLEEKLLATLSAKHELALAALDPDSDVSEVELASGMEELRRRLEVLLGARQDAPIDESEARAVRADTDRLAQRSRVAEAGGQLLSAAFGFLGELIPKGEADDQAGAALAKEFRRMLTDCLERDAQGRPQLTVTLADDAALDGLANSLAAVLSRR